MKKYTIQFRWFVDESLPYDTEDFGPYSADQLEAALMGEIHKYSDKLLDDEYFSRKGADHMHDILYSLEIILANAGNEEGVDIRSFDSLWKEASPKGRAEHILRDLRNEGMAELITIFERIMRDYL